MQHRYPESEWALYEGDPQELLRLTAERPERVVTWLLLI
jgi:hypothetical protein